MKTIQDSIDKAADQAEIEYDIPSYLGEVSDPEDMGDPQMIGLYGPPGHGKTWLGASICLVDGYAPLLIIDTEGSAVGTVSKFPKGLVKIKRVHNLKEYQSVLKGLRADANNPFKTVMVDTYSQVLEWKHDEIWANPIKTSAGADDTQKMWGRLYDYGKVATDALRNAPFRTIITLHEKEERDATGTLYSRMWLDGAIKKYLPSKPDLIGLLVAEAGKKGEKTTRTIYFGADSTRATKTRFEEIGLPNVMQDPTMPAIIGAIRENMSKQQEGK